MEELVDELSGTTIDGYPNKDIPMKAKNIKPVNRTASIINRSKLLILSDSETDDEDILDKKRFSKYLRISKQKNNSLRSKNSKFLSKGKRKRNSTSEIALGTNSSSCSQNHNGLHQNKHLIYRNKSEYMDFEPDNCGSDSSELTDDSPTECNFDGDDEQSDFYDSNANATPHSYRNGDRCKSRSKSEFKIPSKPVNPFFVVDLQDSHHSSLSLWKRRKPH